MDYFLINTKSIPLITNFYTVPPFSIIPMCLQLLFFFFFNDPATTEIYPLPLPAAFPIYGQRREPPGRARRVAGSRPDEEHRVSRRWLDGRLEARREHRAERPRPAVDRQAGRRGRRQLLQLPPALAAGGILRHPRSEPAAIRQAARQRPGDPALRLRQDL